MCFIRWTVFFCIYFLKISSWCTISISYSSVRSTTQYHSITYIQQIYFTHDENLIACVYNIHIKRKDKNAYSKLFERCLDERVENTWYYTFVCLPQLMMIMVIITKMCFQRTNINTANTEILYVAIILRWRSVFVAPNSSVYIEILNKFIIQHREIRMWHLA